MAFDDLTPNQKAVTIELIEELSTGQYESEFFSTATLGKGRFFLLMGIGDVENKDVAAHSQTELQALSSEGYLESLTKPKLAM